MGRVSDLLNSSVALQKFNNKHHLYIHHVSYDTNCDLVVHGIIGDKVFHGGGLQNAVSAYNFEARLRRAGAKKKEVIA